jgi:pimeloyl-ACP methyl ester carboxylesterase
MPKAPQPSWSYRRVRSDVPVLLLVGGADPQDPLANVAHARRELPGSRTVVVPGAGHGSVQHGCVPRLANQFVERGTAAGLDTSCVARYEPPPFFAP